MTGIGRREKRALSIKCALDIFANILPLFVVTFSLSAIDQLLDLFCLQLTLLFISINFLILAAFLLPQNLRQSVDRIIDVVVAIILLYLLRNL